MIPTESLELMAKTLRLFLEGKENEEHRRQRAENLAALGLDFRPEEFESVSVETKEAWHG